MNTLTRRSFFLLPVLPFLAKVKLEPPKVVVIQIDGKLIAEAWKQHYGETLRFPCNNGLDWTRASATLHDY